MNNIPDITQLTSQGLKEEVFNLLLSLDEDPIIEGDVTRIIYHSICSIRATVNNGYIYKLKDCTSDGKYREIVNIFLIYLLKEQIRHEILAKTK